MSAPNVDVGRDEISQAFVITLMIVVLDERINLGFEITGQIVIFQRYPVLQGLVPSLDLALSLRMIGSDKCARSIGFVSHFFSCQIKRISAGFL